MAAVPLFFTNPGISRCTVPPARWRGPFSPSGTASMPPSMPRMMYLRPRNKAGIFSRWTHQMQEAQVYSHDGPIRCRKRRSILTMDQSE
eukprot:1178565-Prorocentrum_minimum.AAC.1